MTTHLIRRKVEPQGPFYETRWCVIGPAGAIDFHMNQQPLPNGMGWIGGIEEHRRTPAKYQEWRRPDHAACWLLEGPCWHDGSSLYASDYLIPLYHALGEDGLWRQLEQEYRDRFEAAGS